MRHRESQSSSPRKLDLGRRRTLQIPREKLVEIAPLAAGRALPLAVHPAVEGVNLAAWIASNRELLRAELRRCGAILFRGFGVRTPEEFERVALALSGSLMQYSFRSTQRSEVGGQVYTSTEYPADQTIPMHNEMSYTSTWPRKIWFFCLRPAERGGETPFADSRQVFARISPAVRRQFADRGVLYVRNYGGGLDLPWENVFQTADRPAVERFCREAGIECEWKAGNRLRTRQRCQGVARHPETGEMIWFNQAHLFHRSSIDPAVLASLLEARGEEDLPRDARYGDGAPIEAATLQEIRRAYAEESVVFPWEEGDVVLVDNMLVAHGRRPFAGQRKVLVTMAEPCGQGDL